MFFKTTGIPTQKLADAVKRVAHVKAISALEGDPSDEYTDYLLMLKASDQISMDDYSAAGIAYIKYGDKLIS